MKTHTFTHTVTRKGLDGLRCLKAVFLMECKAYACTRTYMNALALTYTRARFIYSSASCWIGYGFWARGGCERGGGGVLDVVAAGQTKTCAWLYPEPLCRQETTILRPGASEEPSSTEGGTPKADTGRRATSRGEKRE